MVRLLARGWFWDADVDGIRIDVRVDETCDHYENNIFIKKIVNELASLDDQIAYVT